MSDPRSPKDADEEAAEPGQELDEQVDEEPEATAEPEEAPEEELEADEELETDEGFEADDDLDQEAADERAPAGAADRTRARAAPPAAQPTTAVEEELPYVDDNVSKTWVVLIVAVLAGIFLYGMLFGKAGLLTSSPVPSEPPITPTPQVTAPATVTPSPSPLPSPTTGESPSPQVSPTTLPSPTSTPLQTPASS